MSARHLFIADNAAFGFKDAHGEVLSPKFLAGPGVAMHTLTDRIAAACKEEGGLRILFIDIFIRFKDDGYTEASDLGGIALLKFLRIRGVKQHVVLLSPWDLRELLKKDAAHLILTGPGVTVAPYHFDFAKCGLDVEKIAREKAPEADVLRNHLRPGIKLAKDERHNWANWWGIDRLWYVNELAERRNPGSGREVEGTYPAHLKERIKELRNQEALFCHGNVDKLAHLEMEALQGAVQALEQEQEQLARTMEALRQELVAARAQAEQPVGDMAETRSDTLLDLLKALPPGTDPMLAKVISVHARKPLSATAHSGRSAELRARLHELTAELEAATARKAGADKALLTTQAYWEDQAGLIKETYGVLQAMARETRSAWSGVSVRELRNRLRERTPRILLIDDQAGEGWAEVMQAVIYGGASVAFRAIAPPSHRAVDKDYYKECIQPTLQEHKPQVVLLDLRLSREAGTGQDVDELSGAMVLRQLRKDHPGLPVIMTTASNKAWSLERLLHLGCDGYWIKEGLDVDTPTPASVKNYARFMELVERTTSEPFGNVMRFGQRLLDFATAESRYWWEKPTAKPTIRGATRVEVLSILEEGLYLLRDHLAAVELGRVAVRPANDWFYPSLVPMHLTRIIEEIYDAYESGAIGRTDKVAESLLKRRNSATHLVQPAGQVNARSWDQQKLFTWLNEFMDWLSTPPTSSPGVKVKGTIKL